MKGDNRKDETMNSKATKSCSKWEIQCGLAWCSGYGTGVRGSVLGRAWVMFQTR